MSIVQTKEERDRALAALLAICPVHIKDGRAVADMDCGDCGSRQEAARLYLLGLIEDAQKAMDL